MATKKQKSASDIPSSSILNEHFFKLVNPFVEVREGKVSKFEDKKLASFDSKVADYLLKKVILEMHKFGVCFARSPKVNETQYRPVSCALFPVFAGLAPRKGELLDGEKPKNKSEEVVSAFDMSSISTALGGIGGADQSRPMSRASDSSRDSDRSGFSFTGDTFVHEDGTTLRSRETVDIRASVTYNNNEDVGRAIFEMKGDQTWPFGLYQALNYGARNAVGNIGLKRFKKFHVVVMGIDWVGCAMIDPIGFVTVDHKTISGIDEFKKQVTSKIEYLKQKGKTEEMKNLDARYIKPDPKVLLATLTKGMDEKMKDASKKIGGDYAPEFGSQTKLLVGTATFRKAAFSINKFPIAGTWKLKNELTIVKGFARVLYGDRVLDWKLPAIEKHANKRKKEIDDLVEKVVR